MNISQLTLKDFRNYEALELPLEGGVTVLCGDNAQGKTNVLEAVYLCCTGRSHRTRQDKELIRKGADAAFVQIVSQKRDGRHDVEILLSCASRRKIKIAGQETSRSGELMGHVTGVLFSPEDLRRPAAALSGGQRRRAALLRALLCRDADTLLLDEPFTGMDETLVEQAAAATVRLTAGRDALLVTHDPRAAALLGWPVLHL